MPKAISRRTFLRAGLSVLGCTIAGGPLAWLYASEVEPAWLDVERHVIPLDGLSPALAGFTLAHFSDLHLSSYVSLEAALRVIEVVNGCGAGGGLQRGFRQSASSRRGAGHR